MTAFRFRDYLLFVMPKITKKYSSTRGGATLNINHALLRKIKMVCAKHDVKINRFVEEALEVYIKLKN